MNITNAFDNFILSQKAKGNAKATLEYYNYNILHFIKFCNNHNVLVTTELTIEIYEQYKCYLLEQKLQTRKISLQTYIRAVKVFYKWLYEEQYLLPDINIDKLKLIKAEKVNIIPLSDIEIEMLLNCFDNSFYGIRNKTIILLMIDSGLRRAEVVKLKKQDLNLINHIALIHGKGAKERLVPFGTITERYLKRIINISNYDNPYVFQKQDGTEITDNTIKCFFQDLKRDSQIKRLYPHLLRHTFATNYILSGGDTEELRILLGHSSITTTQIYVHLAAQQKIINQHYHSHIDSILNKKQKFA